MGRVRKHANAFNSLIAVSITPDTLDYAKTTLLSARNSLDLMIETLIQVLYDPRIIKTKEDSVLLGWLKDDLGRYMQELDNSEHTKLIASDNPNADKSMVGVSKLASYMKEMKNTYFSIYEVLLKSIHLYNNFEPTDEFKKDNRTFLYILFNVLSITMSFLGGMTRKPNAKVGNRGMIGSSPLNWQALMTEKGQKVIGESFKSETGKELPDIPEDFLTDTESFGGEIDEPAN